MPKQTTTDDLLASRDGITLPEPLTTWYQVVELDAPQTATMVQKVLWPARSDKNLIPPLAELAKVAHAMRQRSDGEQKLSHKPQLLDNSFMLGDLLLCWQNDFSMSRLYRREVRKA